MTEIEIDSSVENPEVSTQAILQTRFQQEKEIIFRTEETGISQENLTKCAEKLKLTPRLICKDPETFLIRKSMDGLDDFAEVRCVIAGNVDAGKSTLLGVLVSVLLKTIF